MPPKRPLPNPRLLPFSCPNRAPMTELPGELVVSKRSWPSRVAKNLGGFAPSSGNGSCCLGIPCPNLPARLIRSLAVLPLESLSNDASQEYFADGMTDELISDLAKISALRVISRTSVMATSTRASPSANRSRTQTSTQSSKARPPLRRPRPYHRAVDRSSAISTCGLKATRANCATRWRSRIRSPELSPIKSASI